MGIDRKLAARRVVDGLGGVTKAADFFGIRPPSVSGWLKDGLPQARLRHISDVRPELLEAKPPIEISGTAGAVSP